MVRVAALPPQLRVDASDRARSGIRITLDSLSAIARRNRPRPVDCAGSIGADADIRTLEFVIVDVETTGGAWHRGHRITEICAVRMRGDGTWVDEFRTLVNPERPIPIGVAMLTNITTQMVLDAPRFADVAAEVARAIDGAVFVAHNAPFDWAFVGNELQRVGAPLTGRTLCTVQLAKKVVPELQHKSLDDLTWFFQIHNEARHRAYGDARATAEVFRRLLLRCGALEVTRWCELQELLRRRARSKFVLRALQERLL
jgi:DNA polymerase-3 subunit epsilon